MLKKIIYLSIIILYSIICYSIYTNNKNIKPQRKTNTIKYISQTTNKKETKEKKDNSIGNIIITKIDLNQKLYPINSEENTIEKNIKILEYSEEPSKENSIMFLAAHSGTGKIAYFNNLNKLNENDEIILNYKKITYIYKITKIWEIEKTGTISVEKENSTQLILTTCSPEHNNYQLIINANLIHIKK